MVCRQNAFSFDTVGEEKRTFYEKVLKSILRGYIWIICINNFVTSFGGWRGGLLLYEQNAPGEMVGERRGEGSSVQSPEIRFYSQLPVNPETQDSKLIPMTPLPWYICSDMLIELSYFLPSWTHNFDDFKQISTRNITFRRAVLNTYTPAVLNLWVGTLSESSDPFTGVTQDHWKILIFTLQFLTVAKKMILSWGHHNMRSYTNGSQQ